MPIVADGRAETSDSNQKPTGTRTLLGTIVGSTMLAVVATGIIAPRTLAFGFPFMALVLIAAAAAERRLVAVASTLLTRPVVSWDNALLLIWAAFFFYAAISAFWAHSPIIALEKAGIGACYAFLALLCVRLVTAWPGDVPLRLAEGLWMGFIFGAAYLAVEVVTNQAIKIAVINALGLKPSQINPAAYYTWQDNKLVTIWISDLTRNMPPLAIFAAPAIAAAHASVRRPWNVVLVGLFISLTTLAVFGSDSQTAQLGLIAGYVVFGLSVWTARWTSRVLMAGWVSACLLVVPLGYGLGALERTYGLSSNEVGYSPWLTHLLSRASVGARMAILGEYTQRVLDRPVLGHGANMSYILGPIFDATAPKDSGSQATMRQHPHNAYMQIWFELGAIGALLFTLGGLSIVRSITALKARQQDAAFGMFSIFATVIATSYGVWQFWWMAAIAFGVVSLAVAGGGAADIDRAPKSSGE